MISVRAMAGAFAAAAAGACIWWRAALGRSLRLLPATATRSISSSSSPPSSSPVSKGGGGGGRGGGGNEGGEGRSKKDMSPEEIAKRDEMVAKKIAERQAKAEKVRAEAKAKREAAKKAKLDEHNALTDEQRAWWRANQEAEKLVQKMRLQRAMGGGADLEIAVDLSFPREVQIDNECRSLSKQLCHTYNYIKTAEVCTALHLTSFQGKIQDALQPRGGDGWMVHKHVCGLAESFEGREEDLVMLSPDATETLEGLEKGKIYVIGGIVDRTVVKGVTLGKAEEMGIACRRLPVQESVPRKLQGRGHVLNINTTALVLIKYMELGDWAEAFKASLVTEKQARDGLPAAKVGGGKETKSDDSKVCHGQGTRAQVARWAKGQLPSGGGEESKQDGA